MAIYSVRDKQSGTIRLVDADNNARALRHVAADTFEVIVAKPRQIAELVGSGIALETYSADAQPDLPAEPIKSDDQ